MAWRSQKDMLESWLTVSRKDGKTSTSVSCTVTLDYLSLSSLHPSSFSSTPLLLLHLLAVLCRHPWRHSRCHPFFRPGCLPVLLILPPLLRLLLHSLVSGLPSSVQSSSGNSRFCISYSTPQLSPSCSSHPHSLRCSVHPLFALLSQT